MNTCLSPVAARICTTNLNRVYDSMGFWKSNRDYLEILAIPGTRVVSEYQRFSDTANAKALKAALAEANAPFDALGTED